MNAMINAHTFNRRRDDRRAANSSVPPVRLAHPQRDFGVGYGRSSGYAAERSYTTRAFTPLYARA